MSNVFINKLYIKTYTAGMDPAGKSFSVEKQIKCSVLQSISERFSYKHTEGEFDNKTQADIIIFLTEYIQDNGSFIHFLGMLDSALKEYLFHRNYLWFQWKKTYSSEQDKQLEPMLTEILILKKLLVRFFHLENPGYISMSKDDKKYFMIKFKNHVKMESALDCLDFNTLTNIRGEPLLL